MRKSKKFISMPVISLEDSQQVGFIKELVINPESMEIAGLVVEQKGWFKDQKIVPYGKVKSIGGDAVTIEKSSNVEKPANLPEIINLIKNKTLIVGAKVITENGVFMGYVDEFFVDETTGKITFLEIAGNLINTVIKGNVKLDINYIKNIGKEILIADARAEQQLKKSDGGLQDTFSGLKESTSSLLENTLQKTKILGKNIKEYTRRSTLSKKDKASKESEAPTVDNDLPQPAVFNTIDKEEEIKTASQQEAVVNAEKNSSEETTLEKNNEETVEDTVEVNANENIDVIEIEEAKEISDNSESNTEETNK